MSIADLITSGDHHLISVNADPSTGAGAPAEQGSLAFLNDSGVGRFFLKQGAGDTDWINVIDNTGSMILVASATASNDSAIDFTDIDDTYDTYMFIVNGVRPDTNNDEFRARVSFDNGSTFQTTNYKNTADGTTSGIYIAKDMSNTAGDNGVFVLRVTNPSSASLFKAFDVLGTHTKATNVARETNGGYYNAATTAVDAVRFYYASGLIESGDFLLYGIQKTSGSVTPNPNVASVQTTDATQTDLITIGTATDTVKYVEADVIARRTGGTAGTAGDSATYKKYLTIKNVAGTVTVDSRDIDTFEDQDWDVAAVVSGTDVVLKVTGAANNNITWVAYLDPKSV